VNVDVSGDLQGNVTINAIDLTLPQILDRISRQANIRYSVTNSDANGKAAGTSCVGSHRRRRTGSS
jgi:hypothetical protein